MSPRKKRTAYRRKRLRVESLETRRLLAALNEIPTVEESSEQTFSISLWANTGAESSIFGDLNNLALSELNNVTLDDFSDLFGDLVVVNPSLDIVANQGLWFSRTDSDVPDWLPGVSHNHHFTQAHWGPDHSLLTDENDTSNWIHWGSDSSPDADDIAYYERPLTPTTSEYSSTSDISPTSEFSPTRLGGAGGVHGPMIQIEPIQTTTRPVSELENIKRAANNSIENIASAEPVTTSIESASDIFETLGSNTGNILESSASRIMETSASSALESSIDIAENASLTSLGAVAFVAESDLVSGLDESAAEDPTQSSSSEVAFRVEPVMARHHYIELKQRISSPQVTELPTDLPRETATPLVWTGELPASATTSPFSINTRNDAFQKQHAMETSGDAATPTDSGFPHAMTDQRATTAVVLIHDDETVLNEETSGRQSAIDVLMAATAGAIVYTQRERNTEERRTEFRLR